MYGAGKKWLMLSAIVTWVATAIGGAVTFDVRTAVDAPPFSDVNAYVQIVMGVLFGFVIALTNRMLSRGSFWVAVSVAAGALLFSVVFFFSYQIYGAQHTCLYATKVRLVTGTQLTEQARKHLTNNPDVSEPCSLVEDFGGRPDKVWLASDLQEKMLKLSVLYMLAFLSTGLSVFSITRTFGAKSNRKVRS